MGTIAASGSTSTGSAPATEVRDGDRAGVEAPEEQPPAAPDEGGPEDAAPSPAPAAQVPEAPGGDAPADAAPTAEDTAAGAVAEPAATSEDVPGPAEEPPAGQPEEPFPDQPEAAAPVPDGEDVTAGDLWGPAASEPSTAPPADAAPTDEDAGTALEEAQPAAPEPEAGAAAEAEPAEPQAAEGEPAEGEPAEAEPGQPEAEPAEDPATPVEEAPVEEAPAAEPEPVPALDEPSEPARRRPTPGPDAASAEEVTAGLPRPQGPGRAARRLAAERAATQAAIEEALAERAAADREVEQQVARERARRPAVPIPSVVPDAPRSAAPPRGPAVVVASTHRLRRRIIGAVVALVVLVAAGITALVVTRDHGPTTTTAAAVPDARLPTVADPPPVLAALSAQAPQPTRQALAGTLGPLLSAPALGPGVEAEVVDVASGAVLFDQDAATPATPASTAKLLTSAAVLTTLDPESTLTTEVVAGSAPGEVVLVGGGDPTLTRAGTSPSYPGAASVKDLAAQVTAALPGTTITRVVVDGSLFSGPATAGGWQPSDAPSTYAAPITAAMVDGGRTSATSVNRSGTPATDAGQALAAALGAPRATVVQGTAPPGARVLGTVHSAPIARIVEQALSQSDNVLAEALARQVALARHLPATFEGAAQGVLAALRQDGVDTTGVTMVDGSGLSRTDAVPPAVLAGVLTRTASGGLPRASAILSGLAVAGYDGTLVDRGDNDPGTAPGSVRAKTGTLLGVHGLAGTVLTADGRLLVFAILADRSTSGDTPAEGALDRVAAALAACGCR